MSTNSNKKQNKQTKNIKTVKTVDHGPQIAKLSATVEKMAKAQVQLAAGVKKMQPKSEYFGHITASRLRGAAGKDVPKVAKAEKAVEKKLEGVLHKGHLSKGGKHRHGAIRREAIRMTKHGNAQVFSGCERLAEVITGPDTFAGEILDQNQLNPTAFGDRVIALYTRPYSKFIFTKVRIEFEAEAALIEEQTAGAMIMGVNFDPTSSLPVGDSGVNAMNEWPNIERIIIRDNNNKALHVQLGLEAQVPLFVEMNGDQQFESQGNIVLLSSTKLNVAGAGPMPIGEWFIYYEIECYELNTSVDDIGNAVVVASYAQATSGQVLGFTAGPSGATVTDWYGSTNVVIPVESTSTGGSFIAPAEGSYMVEVTYISDGALPASGPPFIYVFEAPNSQPATAFPGTWLAGTLVPNSGNVQVLPSVFTNGNKNLAVVNSNYHTNAGVDTTIGATLWYGTSKIFFSCSAGDLVALYMPSSSGTVVWHGSITVARLDPSFHLDGHINLRPTAIDVMTFYQERLLWLATRLGYDLTDADKLAIMTQLLKAGPASPAEANCVIKALKLDMPLFQMPQTGMMIAPAIVAVATWAITTFGPILAEKAIKFVTDKIEGKKPKKRDGEQLLSAKRIVRKRKSE
jgi:hypothetical protein